VNRRSQTSSSGSVYTNVLPNIGAEVLLVIVNFTTDLAKIYEIIFSG